MARPIPPQTYYEAMGGAQTFAQIAHRFYEQVAADPEFRAMYPEEDLGPAEDRLRMFLSQYWGGPTTYSDQRGHPRLFLRHRPFPVTPTNRDIWVKYMTTSVNEVEMDEELRGVLLEYLDRAATAMINTPDEAN